MSDIKLVLDCCKNYDEVINFKYKSDDNLTQDLINYYKDYVFFNHENKENISMLDMILYKYITDTSFFDYVQGKLKNDDSLLPIDDDLKKIYDSFKEEEFKIINSCRWI